MKIMKCCAVTFFLFFLAACAGTPARIVMTSDKALLEQVREKSEKELCEDLKSVNERYNQSSDELLKRQLVRVKDTVFIVLQEREYEKGYCTNPVHYENVRKDQRAKAIYENTWETEQYNIDTLRITTETLREAKNCITGGIHRILVEGIIGPDSSFAMDQLLERHKPCRVASGKTIPVIVSLRSDGGLLDDGYKLGRSFRSREVTTIIENGQGCASSCAVAFLGGEKRIVEDDGAILFHAPYFSGENEYGKRDISCEVGDEALKRIKEFYQEMTDIETGERLFERTMWYCSADDGWVVTGGAAAALFGIATQR